MSPTFRGTLHTPRRRITAGLLAAAVAFTGLAGLGVISSASASSGAKAAAKPKPTVVLVHGAWADASSFAAVQERLTADGYPVLSFANPLRSLSSDSANLATFLAARTTGPVILVGHSYGGAVVSSAALSDPDVRALVYVDALLPDEGQSVSDLQAATPSDPTQSFDFVPYAGAPEGDFDLYLKKQALDVAFSNGLRGSIKSTLYAQQRPITLAALNEKAVGTPAWKKLPSWYIAGTKDLSVSITLQRAMAKRAGSTVVELKTGHLTMMLKPADVALTIERAANKTK